MCFVAVLRQRPKVLGRSSCDVHIHHAQDYGLSCSVQIRHALDYGLSCDLHIRHAQDYGLSCDVHIRHAQDYGLSCVVRAGFFLLLKVKSYPRWTCMINYLRGIRAFLWTIFSRHFVSAILLRKKSKPNFP